MQEAPVLLKFLAVIRGDHDEGRSSHPQLVEPAEERRELVVPGADLAVVELL